MDVITFLLAQRMYIFDKQYTLAKFKALNTGEYAKLVSSDKREYCGSVELHCPKSEGGPDVVVKIAAYVRIRTKGNIGFVLKVVYMGMPRQPDKTIRYMADQASRESFIITDPLGALTRLDAMRLPPEERHSCAVRIAQGNVGAVYESAGKGNLEYKSLHTFSGRLS